MSTHDATRERFARTAERVAALQDARAAELEEKVVRIVAPSGEERALDSGSGAGALAFALAPHVREVVAVDLVPELLEQGRKRAERFPNVTFVEGDATKLPFEYGSFDLACTRRQQRTWSGLQARVVVRLFCDNQSRLRPGHRVRSDPAAALATAQLM